MPAQFPDQKSSQPSQPQYQFQFHHQLLTLETSPGVEIYNLTPQLQHLIATTGMLQGQVLVFVRHTTTALTINEDEPRLLADLKAYLQRLAPSEDKYLHNDLHLRDVPPDEPENAHAHLMAIMLSTHETIPVWERQLGLGTWQSLLFLELDGPRTRQVLVQMQGEFQQTLAVEG